MFTDHMFFSGATEMFWLLVMLTSVAASCRVQCFGKGLRKIPLHSTSGSPALSNPICLVALRSNRGACSSNDFRSGALLVLARTVLDLFPSRSGPAIGEEETSC